MTSSRPSAALAAMQAFHEALMNTRAYKAPLGGQKNHALGRALHDLIALGAKFERDDMAAIGRLGTYSKLGRFDPLGIDTYDLAVATGNAGAAASWEAATGWPRGGWSWPGEHTIPEHGAAYRRIAARLPRICSMSAIRIGGTWWRVYRLDVNEARLAAYPGDVGWKPAPDVRRGIKRQTLDREQWGQLVLAEQERLSAAHAARATLQVPVDARVVPEDGWREQEARLPAGLVLTPVEWRRVERALGSWDARSRPEGDVGVDLAARAEPGLPAGSYRAAASAWRAALPEAGS